MFPNTWKYKINSLVGSREGTPSTWLIESFLRFTDVRQSDSFAFYLMKEIHWWFDGSHGYVMGMILICTFGRTAPISSYKFKSPIVNHRASLIAQLVKSLPARQEILVQFLDGRRDKLPTPVFLGFPGGSDSKESTCNAGDLGSIRGTWLGRSPGGGHGNPLQ